MRFEHWRRAGDRRPAAAATTALAAPASRASQRSPAVAAAVAAAIGVLGLATACGGAAVDQSSQPSDGRPAAEQPAQAATTTAGQADDAPAEAWEAADPVRITIADIGVSAPVVPLNLDENRRLEAPTGFDETGWNRAGPEPGEPGAAVVAGHVDSQAGPAVFYRLRELRPGAAVTVERADGTSVTFRVDRIAVYPKDAFPSEQVYVGDGRPELRLITCGGAFDTAERSYVDNVVVFASEAAG